MDITVKELDNLKTGVWLSQSLGRGNGVFTARRTAEGIAFYFRHTLPDGERDTFKFATYDKNGANGGITLKEARQKVSELSRLYKEHPELRSFLEEQQHQETERINQARAERKKSTLDALLKGYIEHLERQGKTKSAQDVKSLFRRRIFEPFPDLAKMKANSITGPNLKTIIAAVLDDGKGRAAAKLRSYLSAAFACAIKADSDPEIPSCLHDFNILANPVSAVASLSKFNIAREIFLTKSEFKVFWNKLQTIEGVTGAALRLCVLLGGQRPFQLLRLQEKDVDFEGNTVTLYDIKGRRSTPRRHILPLTESAIKELRALMEINNPYLFSSTKGKVPLDIKSLSNKIITISNEMIAEGIRKEPFQLRDVRRTIETTLASMGVSMEVRAQLQSHGLSGVQARHYDKYDYMSEKLAAMEKLHRMLTEERATITPLRATK